MLAIAVILAAFGARIRPAVGGEPAAAGETFVARLVRPDRQAAEVLRLFDGTPWSGPAAALAAWKRRQLETGLGKPLEALIALFNPEMTHEWRCFDGAEIRVGRDPATGDLCWFAIVPRDDGTIAAGMTAMRLTYPDDRPLSLDGKEIPVARLGRSGLPLACQLGPVIVIGSSRDRLERGVAVARSGRARDRADPRESRTLFQLDAGRLSVASSDTLARRRLIEALRACRCRRVDGAAFLNDGSLVLDLTMIFPDGEAAIAGRPRRRIERAWLGRLPSDGVLAMASLAVESDPAWWDRIFDAADRIERLDSRRARLAPLRSRVNLLAIGAGLGFESDIRPHLLGVTACLIGEPGRPGRVAGAVVLLHLDGPAIAARIVEKATPRLVAMIGGAQPGRTVILRARDRDVWIAWGSGIRAASGEARPAPGRSLADLCGGWAARGAGTPARVGAAWPARLWRPVGMPAPVARALADDPPVVWWGWNEPGRTRDLLRWTGLQERVRRVLASLPIGPVPHPTASADRIDESRVRTER